ncbi:signal recognition particle protein [Acidiferrobacter sp.]|uniref:signal recognition particle protein n=1 Tax=Acidiferrobacter sp. TaxID=1872107 RepID=UPI002614A93E|nr:signal recognition particle protein [Acidiferrobacter sp.]
MFETLSNRLRGALRALRKEARLTEKNIGETLREVRIALLEADVALSTTKSLIETIRARALGQEVMATLNPSQAVVKIVHDTLVETMGAACDRLNLAARPPAVVLLAGLQGSGKTTSAAKLARLLRERERKKVALVSVDVYRPAAMDQLERLAEEVGAVFYKGLPTEPPEPIARRALDQARREAIDVLIVDTAGRLHIDEVMMNEVRALHAATTPIETLFVVDSMTGQDAVHTAKAFDEALALTGVILTKTDGDARGGAALSLRAVIGKPIKFLGTGEKTDGLEPFHPERLASRILGMGDVLTLIEEAERKVDRQSAERLAEKFKKGKGFDLEDFREQMLQMERMGGMAGVLDKLPGMNELPASARAQLQNHDTRRLVAIINSMTPQERHFPDTIRGSRKRRIALGSGTGVPEVNRLLKQFAQAQRMMKQMGKGGLKRMLAGMKGKMPGMPF